VLHFGNTGPSCCSTTERQEGAGKMSRPHLEHICPKTLTSCLSSDMVQKLNYGQNPLPRAAEQTTSLLRASVI
jgi:hypothetical protein